MKTIVNCALVTGWIAVGLGSGGAIASEAQKPLGGVATGPFDSDFDQVVVDLLDRWHVPGVAIGVIDGDKTWTKGYGFADIESQRPVTPHTLFYGCSTTKAFTGATVARIIDSGEYRNPASPQFPVTWKTPIADILPDDFVLQDEWATTHLTLEDALTHRSGMPRHDESYGGYDATLKDTVRSLRYLPLSEPPRTKYQYCNLMFVVASHAVESLTSRWLGDVFRDWIWAPLGMDETFLDIQDARKAGAEVATGYYWHPDEQTFKVAPYMRFLDVSGAGAILSNVVDYTKWIRALVNEDKHLTKGVYDAIKAPRIFESGSPGAYDSPQGYALGWLTTSYKGHRIWHHSGGADTWGAQVLLLPDLDFGVVTFSNIGVTSNAIGETLVYKLVNEKAGVPQDKSYDWEAKWRDVMAKAANVSKNAEETLFPDRPTKPVKHALPLESYAGTYYHPAFRNTTISLDGPTGNRRPNSQLAVERADAIWQLTGELEHVSGEFWILYSYLTQVPTSTLNISPVEFKIGADGKVTSLEIEWGNAPRGEGEGVFTFEKIAS